MGTWHVLLAGCTLALSWMPTAPHFLTMRGAVMLDHRGFMMTTLLLSTLNQPPTSRDANFDQVCEASLRCLQCVQTAPGSLDSCLSRRGFEQWLGAGLVAWEALIRPAGHLLSEQPRAWERFEGPSWHHIPISAVCHLNDIVANAAIRLSDAGGPQDWPAVKGLVRKPFEELARLPWDELRQKIEAEYANAKNRSQATRITGDEKRTDEDTSSPAPRRGKGKHINERMLAELRDNPTSCLWSAQAWADRFKCSKSTIAGTKTWKVTIPLLRAMEQSNRRDKRSADI